MILEKDLRGNEPEPAALAADLLGHAVDICEAIRKGGNNGVYRIKSGGRNFLLKLYNPQSADRRDRLGAESGAYQFLHRHGIRNVPEVVAVSERDHAALYTWLDGAPSDVPAADIHNLADFLIDLQRLRQAERADRLPPAADACSSPADTLRLAQRRLDRLQEIVPAHSELKASFTDELLPLFADTETRIKKAYGNKLETPLPFAQQCLSPSDFGFHNALRQPDGNFVFFDFEYFGWDDPVKATADVIYHAGMELPAELGRIFAARMRDFWTPIDSDFPQRLRLAKPLYGLVWCCIILNEFLPERWARRVMAKGAMDQEQMQQKQMQKAQGLFARLKDEMHDGG